MDLDRQAIERKDFPIGRRGYDPDAVDAHLRALAGEFEDIQRTAAHGSPDLSLASSAATQVQSILEAAEATAADIEHNALEEARAVREEADRDADQNREESLERARAHVAAVEQAASGLLERVGSMEGEVGALVGEPPRRRPPPGERPRRGRDRHARALRRRLRPRRRARREGAGSRRSGAEPVQEAAPGERPGRARRAGRAARPAEPAASAEAAPPAPAEPPGPEPEAVPGDLDGARLVALNMALNGESRAETERYLAENFELPDRLKLIDEVYAAVEG